MTVTMTASGAQLLLLALCACSGSGLQQSAPRVRLSFKGDFIHINSSDTIVWFVPTKSPAHTEEHPQQQLCFLFMHMCGTYFLPHVKQHYPGNKRWILRVVGFWWCPSTSSFSPHPITHRHRSPTSQLFFVFRVWHDDARTLHLKNDRESTMIFHT